MQYSSPHEKYAFPYGIFDILNIEAPCSKPQGIFDPQGSTLYSNRSLTPQHDTGESACS